MARRPVKENRLQLEYELVRRRVKGMTLKEIADDLNNADPPIRSLTGRRWYINSVRRLLTEPSAEMLMLYVMGAEGLLPAQKSSVSGDDPRPSYGRAAWRARLDDLLAGGKPIEIHVPVSPGSDKQRPITRGEWHAQKAPRGKGR